MKTETIGTWDDFFRKYTPEKNKLDDNACLDGCMFETYGEEVKYVQEVAATMPNNVWTYIVADGFYLISNGWHFVNRMGYLITSEPGHGEDYVDCEEEI